VKQVAKKGLAWLNLDPEDDRLTLDGLHGVISQKIVLYLTKSAQLKFMKLGSKREGYHECQASKHLEAGSHCLFEGNFPAFARTYVKDTESSVTTAGSLARTAPPISYVR
jgi:hypothetical protein